MKRNMELDKKVSKKNMNFQHLAVITRNSDFFFNLEKTAAKSKLKENRLRKIFRKSLRMLS